MQTIEEKVSNADSSGKAHVDIYKAKVEEKAKKATARTEEEKEIAHQLRKDKEAKAKMELHQGKAEHAVEKLRAKQSQLYGHHHHHHHHSHDPTKLTGTQYFENESVVGSQGQVPVGQKAATTGVTLPAYRLGGTSLGM